MFKLERSGTAPRPGLGNAGGVVGISLPTIRLISAHVGQCMGKAAVRRKRSLTKTAMWETMWKGTDSQEVSLEAAIL